MDADDIIKILLCGKRNPNPAAIPFKVSKVIMLFCDIDDLPLKIVALIRCFIC